MEKTKSESKSFSGLADLHMHLGTASTAHLLWEIAHQRGLTLPEKDYWKFLKSIEINHNLGWESYHNYFDVVQQIQSSPDAVSTSVTEAISLSYRKASLDLLELRFNPMRRNNGKQFDLDWVIFAAIMGIKRAMMMYPIKVGLILEMDRRFDFKKNEVIVEKAIKFRHEGIVGIDISGPDDSNFSMKEILPLIEKAKSFGLKVTIHTGETPDLSEMEYVIDYLKPDRIGHGIQCVKNPLIMDKLVKNQIVLEVCPSSNVTLGIVKNWQEMSDIIKTLKQREVLFTINSDSPVLLKTNTLNEYKLLQSQQILTHEDLIQCNNIAHKYSFAKHDI